VITFKPLLLYSPVGGFSAVSAGLLVALRQVCPELDLPLPGTGFKARYLAPLALAGAVVAAATGEAPLGPCLLVAYGTVAAWAYIRYAQPAADGGRGDANFTLGGFLPEGWGGGLDASVKAVEDGVSKLLPKSRAQPRRPAPTPASAPREAPLAQADAGPSSRPLVGEDEEAARKRERGQKLLEEKMKERAQRLKEGGGNKSSEKPSEEP